MTRQQPHASKAWQRGDGSWCPVPRRSFLRGVLGGAAGVAATNFVCTGVPMPREPAYEDGYNKLATEDSTHSIPFHGDHQAGIATPPQTAAAFLSFDVVADNRIGPRRRRRQMPRPPNRVKLPISHLSQRQVRRLALRQQRRPIHRRPHQRMTKPHPLPQLHQPIRLGRHRSRRRNRQSLGRAPHQRGVTDRLRRRHQQQPARITRQNLKPVAKTLLDPANSVALNPCGSSSNASGFPLASAKTRSRTS
jgi:hypothetical protein